MNVLIVYGGKSCEHDISIITACLAKGYFSGNVYSAYFAKNNECYLAPNDLTPKKHIGAKFNKKISFVFGEGKIAVYKGKRILKYIPVDVAVNCCHGLHGEDGTVAALCGISNIPIVGSDVIASAVAMDKAVSKAMLNSLDIPNVKGCVVTKKMGNPSQAVCDKLAFPVIVKPCTLGSSIGVKVCKDSDELKQALLTAFRYDDKVLCEQALTDFFELNCSAMRVNGKVEISDVDCPYTVNDILTFNDKYIANESYKREKLDVAEETVAQVKDLTRKVYEEMAFDGVIRVDFLFDNATATLYVNEINSIPGSLAYGLWESRMNRREFGEALVAQAIGDYRESQQHLYVFDSGVLSFGGIKK